MAARRKISAIAGPLFLGFDSSTQGLKVLAITSAGDIVYENSLKYCDHFEEYAITADGVRHWDTGEVTQQPRMWVQALDTVLRRMQDDEFPFSQVKALSGSGQQHGAVFLSVDGIVDCFTVEHSPVWMDHTTTEQCKQLEEAVGGALRLAEMTGSRAYERFTGPQIMKIFQNSPETYDKTDRICLISSFLASLFVGRVAPLDYSDGSGMNLLNIHSRDWWQPALDAVAPRLRDKLGEAVPSLTSVGTISPYMQQRYGFDEQTIVCAWSGDNPNSLAGLNLTRLGDIAISLGTSDTVFGIATEPTPSTSGHIFVNPLDEFSFMPMLCYKNGSLTRERIRDDCANGSWDTFNSLLAQTSPGNDGKIGFYMFWPEITPPLQPCVYRFSTQSFGTALYMNTNSERVDEFDPASEVRAVCESQCLRMRAHSESIGMLTPKRLIVTGGASSNSQLLQLLADVFGCPVYKTDTPEGAALGSALRAMCVFMKETGSSDVQFSDCVDDRHLQLQASPNIDNFRMYTRMLSEFKELQAQLMAMNSAPMHAKC